MTRSNAFGPLGDISSMLEQMFINQGDVSWYICIPLVIVFLTARFALESFVYTCAMSVRPKKEADNRKFAESVVKFITHSIAFYFEWTVTEEDGYSLYNLQTLWMKYPQPRSFNLQMLYLSSLSLYFANVIALCFFETLRKDFWVMLSHHIFAAALITYSYSYQFHPVGLLVLMIHEPSDIVIQAAKCCKYAAYEMAARILFICLIISWAYSRLYLLSSTVAYSAMFECRTIAYNYNAELLKYTYDMPLVWYSFNSVLWILVLFHIYWFYLMVQVLVKDIRGEGLSDVRDHQSHRD